jgi:hypothetical protein
LSLALAGCATVVPTHMQVPPELAGVQPQPVQGRNGSNHPVSFGRWIVSVPATFFAEGTSIGRDAPLAEPVIVTFDTKVRLDKLVTKFQFVLDSRAASGNTSWSADCVAEQRDINHLQGNWEESDETELTQPGYPILDCRFTGPQLGRMGLHADFTTLRDSGTVRIPGADWDVRSINHGENERAYLALNRFGYELLQDGQVVAAVETFGDGRVWMQPGLSPQEEDAQAVVMTALLYYAEMLTMQED